jgi:PAS domain S-box-containing protein
MIPDPPLPRVGARGDDLPRRPALVPMVPALAVVAAAAVAVAFSVGAWGAAGLVAGALVAGGFAALYLRALKRELVEVRRARAASERRYRGLYDNIALGVFSADRSGRLTSANRSLVTLLGYGSEPELLAADFGQTAYIGPGTFEAVLLRARTQGALENLEMRLRRFDGLTVTVLATIQALWDEAGEVALFEGTVADHTRERLAESQRRSMERRFRRLFDSNAVGMLIGNLRRGTLEEANPALIERFGLRPSELPVPLEKVIPQDQRPLHRSLRAALEMHATAGPLPAEYVRADGERVPVFVSAAMVEPQHGEFVAVLVDRAAEADAGRRAAQIQSCFEATLDDSSTWIAQFDHERGLVRCNDALCDWLGVSAAPLGRALTDLFGPACPAAAAAAVARALGGDAAHFALDVERGGRVYRLDLTLVPRCSVNGAAAGFLAFINDRAAAVEPPATDAVATPASGRAPAECADGRRTA